CAGRAGGRAHRAPAGGRRYGPARASLYIDGNADCGMRNRREYNSRGMKRVLSMLAMAAGCAVCLAAQAGRRTVSLVVSGGTVITENAAHQMLTPGSVAID